MIRLRHSHLEAMGEIKLANPWIEDVWGIGRFAIVHWQNLLHEPWSSGPTPRHIWRFLGVPGLEVIIRAGVAPRAHNEVKDQ